MINNSDDPVDDSSDFELLDLMIMEVTWTNSPSNFRILYCKNEVQESEEDETLGISFTSHQLQPWSHG
jgi:hypothetical protein